VALKLPSLIAPSDLLDQVDGIEKGLRQRQRIGVVSGAITCDFTCDLTCTSDGYSDR